MVYDDDTVQLVRGRTANSLNALHRGYRYSKDGKPTLCGKQAWRCHRKNDKCPGRLYTVNGELHSVTRPHIHDPDIGDCEAREALSTVKNLAASTPSSNHRIYCTATGALSDAGRLRLPNRAAVKKQAQRARRAENPRPRAPASLAELLLQEDDSLSLKGDTMLLYDNKDEG